MNMYKIYLKQAWALLKENKLLSGVSIFGTALAICMIMVIVIVWQMRTANYSPEDYRDRMMYVSDTRASYKENESYNDCYFLASRVVKDCFYPLRSAEKVGMAYHGVQRLAAVADHTVEFKCDVTFTDAAFWNIFNFRFLSGKPYGEEEVQSGIMDAVVSESVARRLYGTTEVVGRTVEISYVPYTIRAVVRDVSLLAEYRLNDAWTARFDYSYSQDNYNDNQARGMAYDSATGNLTRRVDGTHGSTQKMHSTRADLQGNVVVGGFYNELLTGVAYENYDLLRTDMLRCKNVKGFNIYHPVYGTLDTCNTVSASDSDQRIQQESYAAYVQDALYLTDNWIAVAGVRYQYYTQYAGKGRPFNVNTDSRDEKWTPKAGLVYKVTPNVSLFANVAQSFMPQSSIASYIGELPPEESTSYEVGAKFDLLNGITANIALFDIHKRNVLYTESIGDETVAKTAGKVRSQGVEVDLAGSITDNLSVIASYGYTDAKVLEDPDYAGKPLPNVPKHTGSLFLTYDIHNVYNSNTLTVGGGGHAVSKRSGTNGADYYLQGYAVADVFAAYKMKLQYPVTLQVNVKNLFDKTYYTSSIGTNNLGNQIGDPREVQFTVKMDF